MKIAVYLMILGLTCAFTNISGGGYGSERVKTEAKKFSNYMCIQRNIHNDSIKSVEIARVQHSIDSLTTLCKNTKP
jgi:hypothetical protein